MKPTIALIGPGRVGSSFCKRLTLAGYQLTSVIGRNKAKAVEACSYIGCPQEIATDVIAKDLTAQIIFLAVPDDLIESVAKQLHDTVNFDKHTIIIHFSGLHPAAILHNNSSQAMVLSLHPLLPFASRQIALENLAQCPCALESDNPQALILGKQLVDAVGGRYFTIDSDKKALYHASSCIASNYLVTLLDSAQGLFEKCGIPPDQAAQLLLPLMHASLQNIQKLGTEQGLTGPIVRGDIGTINKHLTALKNDAPELLPLYRQLGSATTALSQRSARLDKNSAIKLQTLLKGSNH